MNHDNLETCPCDRKSDALYVYEQGPNKVKQCYGCGFCTNSYMKIDEKFFEEQLESLPELYKDLVWEDEDGYKWMPSIINLPETGMVFANGTNINNWMWASVKAVEVKEEEKEKFPIPGKKGQFYKHRMDMETMKMFSQYDFIEAMDYAGLFENSLVKE